MPFFKDFKSEIRLFLIVAAVSTVLAAAGILLLQAGLKPFSPTPEQPAVEQTLPPAPSPEPQAEVLDTSDPALSEVEGWQTYRSEEFGFEVRYPENLFASENSTVYNNRNSITLLFSTDQRVGFEDIPPGSIAPPPNVIDLISVDVQEATKTRLEDYNLNHMEYTMLEAYEAIRLFPDTLPYLWPGYIILWNEKEYVLTSSGSELGEQILSTFRFVE